MQELYCIEMLARVDTLCLDKTGTITDGSMRVRESIDLRGGSTAFTVKEIVSSMNSALKGDNMTSKALKKYFGSPRKPVLAATALLPFSSERKFSAVTFGSAGTYILGAPEFVLKTPSQRISDLVRKYAVQGMRVLLLAHTSAGIISGAVSSVRRPVAVIVIEDRIRPDASETIKWFADNGVAVKVISGDSPDTVSSIAMRVGIADADKFISLEGLNDEQVEQAASQYTVFGRVSPDQKAILVRAMRKQGHTVAMTGDGVNDILAMKESDCSISLAGGSDAARKVAHLVLMDDSFTALPSVVAEGRRVVNNIQSATSMYFMKTVYVIVINVMLIVMHFLMDMTMVSPLTNLQVTLMDWVVVALPTTLLALQPNENRIKGNFFLNVLKRCLPASLTFITVTVSLYALYGADRTFIPQEQLGTLVTISYTFGGVFALYYACKPFNKWKIALYAAVFLAVVLCVTIPAISSLLTYVTLGREQLLLLLVTILLQPFLLYLFVRLFNLRLPNKTQLCNGTNNPETFCSINTFVRIATYNAYKYYRRKLSLRRKPHIRQRHPASKRGGQHSPCGGKRHRQKHAAFLHSGGKFSFRGNNYPAKRFVRWVPQTKRSPALSSDCERRDDDGVCRADGIAFQAGRGGKTDVGGCLRLARICPSCGKIPQAHLAGGRFGSVPFDGKGEHRA